MVSFTKCVVRNDVFDNLDQNNPCNADLQVARVNAALAECGELQELAKDGIPKVIFLGSLVRMDCIKLVEAGQKGNNVYMPWNAARDKLTLAHELGHLLGLNHPPDSDEVCETPQLMCPYGPQQTRDIMDGDFVVAKKRAIELQALKWK